MNILKFQLSCLLKMLLQRLVQLCFKYAVVCFELNVSKFEPSSFQGRLHKKVKAYVLVYLIMKVLKFCNLKSQCCNFPAHENMHKHRDFFMIFYNQWLPKKNMFKRGVDNTTQFRCLGSLKVIIQWQDGK